MSDMRPWFLKDQEEALSSNLHELFTEKLVTAQKIKFSIIDFFSKCDQIQIWSHLLKKSLMVNFFLSAVLFLIEVIIKTVNRLH